MKFVNLLKKELKELINVQMIIGLVFTLIIFTVLGNVMTSTIEEASKTMYKVSISDRDNTEFTQQLLDKMKENGAEIKLYTTSGDDYSAILSENDISSLID